MEFVDAPPPPKAKRGGGNDWDDDGDEDEEMELEQVDVQSNDSDDEDLEQVPLEDPSHDHYAAVHAEESAAATPNDGGEDSPAVPVFYDGKGQMRGPVTDATPLSITLNKDAAADGDESTRKRRTNFVTPRDRAIRSDSHKIHVLALLAHAKVRNAWLNDENLRDVLYNTTPVGLRQKLRAIHPKKEPQQRERVRLFEAFMGELVRWWAVKFYLDPDMSAAGAIRQPNAELVAGKFPKRGRRVDGWIVESEKDREQRLRRVEKERQDAREGKAKAKGKGKPKNSASSATATAPPPSSSSSSTPRRKTYRPLRLATPRNPRDSISLFPPGPPSELTSTPTLLHLIQPPPEPIRSPADLIASAEARAGSRETSAQLFCALCRSLGIPARLVISPQVAPWSISAAKVAQPGAGTAKGKRNKNMEAQRARFARRGSQEATSDDYDYEEDDGDANGFSISGSKQTPVVKGKAKSVAQRTPARSRTGTASRPASVASTGSDVQEVQPDAASASGPTPRRSARQVIDVDAEPDDAASGKRGRKSTAQTKGKGKGKESKDAASAADGDYRDEKWKGLTTPLEVEYKPKLRTFTSTKPKEGNLAPQDLDDVDPVDLTAPPTMWVEVFSKPFQKWLTVDPIRARVTPTGNRHMEPLPYDRTNKLVYVVAFEEDGFARDVTARYTKTLHSRVSKLRPPATRNRKNEEQDWWSKVVAAFHRPERLERDAAEDVELEEAASKEPMPNSVGGFKDHPVFILERFLKRDEALKPYIQVGTFQAIPVFHRKNVVTLRSARQWYNEGRTVKPDAGEPLKWVKTRGYTLANKRAEEQARQDGNEDSLKEGLYSRDQTTVYIPPAVTQDPSTGKYTIPKNHFGNIDLFVPSMLPAGAVHIPHTGTSKIARKLNIDYAEAIVGFEFRKHRSNPTMRGIVIPAEYEDVLLDAYWESQHAAAEKELSKQQERAMKLWRKFVAGLSIARRVQEQYRREGAGAASTGTQAVAAPAEEGDGDGSEAAAPGGFLVDEEEHDEVNEVDAVGRRASTPPAPRSKMAAKLDKYGSNTGRGVAGRRAADESDGEDDGEDDDEHENAQSGLSAADVEMSAVDTVDYAVPIDAEAPSGPFLSFDDLRSAEQEQRDALETQRDQVSANTTTATPSKRRRIVLRNGSNKNGGAAPAPAPAPAAEKPVRGKRAPAPRASTATRTRGRKRKQDTPDDGDGDGGKDEDIEATPAPRSGTRRSTRASTRNAPRRSLREPSFDSADE